MYNIFFYRNNKCGKIYCSGGNEFPITKTKHEITMGWKKCKVAVDVRGKEDIGIVPTGTKCGTNKVSKSNVNSVFCLLYSCLLNLKV